MSQIKLSENFIKSNVRLALNEDLYPSGDITSDLIKNNKIIEAKLISNQNAVIGGGRYDNLIKELGGRDLPAIGFALGIDRLAEIIKINNKTKNLFIGCIDDESINFAQYIGNKLRQNVNGIVVENYLGNANVAKQLKKANSQGFKFVMIVGQEEQKTKTFKLKNLTDSSEKTLSEEELVEFLNGR